MSPEEPTDSKTENSLWKTGERTGKTTRETDDVPLDEKAKRILAALQDSPRMTARELSEIIGITAKGVEWHLKRLKAGGLLVREGGRARGVWKVTPPNRETDRETAGETAGKTTGETSPSFLDEKAKRILAALQDSPRMTARELSELVGITSKGVEWHLKRLKAGGLLVREGGRARGVWKVLPFETPCRGTNFHMP